MARGLSTDQQRPQPDLAALPELIDQARRAGTDVVLRQEVGERPATGAEATHVPAVSAVPAVIERTAYRVVQEGLTNARKHAPGHRVLVLVRRASTDQEWSDRYDQRDMPDRRDMTALEVVVEDTPPGAVSGTDGAAWFLSGAAAQGRPGSTPGAGLGLVGLRERVELVDGELQHGPVAGGFRLRALLPLSATQHGAPGADHSDRSNARDHQSDGRSDGRSKHSQRDGGGAFA